MPRPYLELSDGNVLPVDKAIGVYVVGDGLN